MHLLTTWHLKLAQRAHEAITTSLLRQNDSILKSPYHPFTHCILALSGNKNMFNSIYTYARIYHMLVREIYAYTWWRHQMEIVSIRWACEIVEQTIWTPVIWDDIVLIMTSLYWLIETYVPDDINSLWRSDAIWQDGSGSTLAQVMACGIHFKPSLYYKLNIVFASRLWLAIGHQAYVPVHDLLTVHLE